MSGVQKKGVVVYSKRIIVQAMFGESPKTYNCDRFISEIKHSGIVEVI